MVPPSRFGVWLGVSSLVRGIRLFWATPRLWPLGILPVLLAAAIVLGAGGVLATRLGSLVAVLTPFAGGWSEPWRSVIHFGVGLIVVLAFGAAAVLSFAALTQLIGQPFYDQISNQIDASLGDPPPASQGPLWRSLPRTIWESVLLLALAGASSAPLLLLGFVPVIGQTVIPVLGVAVGGFFLGVELLGTPLERRGLRLRARLHFARTHLAAVIGFGAGAFLLLWVPIVNLLAMPGAIVGATLLVRSLTEPQ